MVVCCHLDLNHDIIKRNVFSGDQLFGVGFLHGYVKAKVAPGRGGLGRGVSERAHLRCSSTFDA